MTTDFLFALNANIQHLDVTVRDYLPEGAYRTLYQWALFEDNSHQDVWLQVIGLTQLVKMTSLLLGGLVKDDDWGQLIEDSLLMNGYQIYEIVSDNLAIGITDHRASQIRESLLIFNHSMLARLQYDVIIPTDVFMEAMGGISIFAQSLSPHRHISIAETFLAKHPSLTIYDIEYNLPALLIANIETCYNLYRACDTLVGGRLVQDGLVARYHAMNQLIFCPDMPYEERLLMSADAILVVPTLAYYIAVIAEHIYKLPNFALIANDKPLANVLNDAAMIVRLLNDLGASVNQSPQSRECMMQSFAEMGKNGVETLHDCVVQSDMGSKITRLQKDATHGEFNLALHQLEYEAPTPEVLGEFSERLAFLAQTYKVTYIRMEKGLIEVEKQLGHSLVSSLIRRFVQFHVQLYSHDYKGEMGEYAI